MILPAVFRFLSADIAERYLAELRDECAWGQKSSVFGHLQPCLTASYGDEGVAYFYSGTENTALLWTPTLLEIKQKIEAARGRYNYSLLNRYRSGQDSVKLEGSASLQEGKPLVRLWKDGKEDTPLDTKSPYWMEVRILDGDGKQATELPLKGGCFETPLPKAIFEGNPKTITVNWIDFYRN